MAVTEAPSAPAESQDTIGTQDGNIADGQAPSVTEETAAPETAVEAAPAESVETDSDAAPEASETPDPFAALSDDEFAEHPRVKDVVARREQSARDRAKAEAEASAAVERAQLVASGEWLNEITGAVTMGDDGNPVIDRKKADATLGKVVKAAGDLADRDFAAVLNSMVPEGATVPAEKAQAMAALGQEVLAGNKPMAEYKRAQLELAYDLKLAADLPKLRKEWEREYKREQQANQTVQQRQEAETKRKAQPAPTTGIQGAGGAVYARQRDIDTAHVKGELSDTEVRELRSSGRYHALPY